MKRLLLFALLFCSSLALTIDIQPNFIRALPGESFQITVTIVSDSSGFYSLKVEGAGISIAKGYELIPGQSFKVPFSATAPVESGEYTITATVSFGQAEVTGSARVSVISGSEESRVVNVTLHKLRYDLDELIVRASGLSDAAVSSKLVEAEQLVNQANSSYQTGHLISAQSSLEEAQDKIIQARTIIEIAEKSQWNINIGMLALGVLVILIAYFLMRHLK